MSEPKPSMQLDRIKALTDGVLAIVLTILVLGFEVPDHDFSEAGLRSFLRKLLEPFLAYVVTFGIVSTYWVQHTAIFHYMRIANRSFVWLNLLLLLPMALLPFFTNMRAVYHEYYPVTMFYACANVIIGLLMLATWRFATTHGLALPQARVVDRSMRNRILLGIGINVVGAAVAPISVHLSSAFFLTLPLIYLSHREVDAHWHAAQNED